MHAIDEFYIGTPQEYHCCFNVWIRKTKVEQVVDTIFVKYKYLAQPTITPEDVVIQTTSDLKQALAGVVPQSNKIRESPAPTGHIPPHSGKPARIYPISKGAQTSYFSACSTNAKGGARVIE